MGLRTDKEQAVETRPTPRLNLEVFGMFIKHVNEYSRLYGDKK